MARSFDQWLSEERRWEVIQKTEILCFLQFSKRSGRRPIILSTCCAALWWIMRNVLLVLNNILWHVAGKHNQTSVHQTTLSLIVWYSNHHISFIWVRSSSSFFSRRTIWRPPGNPWQWIRHCICLRRRCFFTFCCLSTKQSAFHFHLSGDRILLDSHQAEAKFLWRRTDTLLREQGKREEAAVSSFIRLELTIASILTS